MRTGSEPLRVLLVGAGVANGRRRPWAHLTRSLPDGCVAFLADSSAVRGPDEALTALRWQLRVNAPHLVVRILDDHSHPNEGAGIDDELSSLGESGRCPTVAVSQPWSADPSPVFYDLGITVGSGAPSPKAELSLHLPLAINAELLRSGLSHPAGRPSDVVLYGPATSAGSTVAIQLLERGYRVRLLHPSWEDDPRFRGLAHGRWPMAYRAALLGRAGLVIATGADGATDEHAKRDQRALEALAVGATVAAFGPVRDAAGQSVITLEEDDKGAWSQEIVDLLGRAAPPLVAGDTSLPRWQQHWHDVLEALQERLEGCTPVARDWERAPAHTRLARHRSRVAFLMPVYNGAGYLRQAAGSVLEQSDPDLELIIVDDGSTDDTWQVACALADEDHRVKAFRQPNIGQLGRFDLLHQQAITETDADLLAFLGADDIAAPRRLEQQRQMFDDEPELDVAFSEGLTIDGDGRPLGRVWHDTAGFDRWSMARTLLTHVPIGHPTVTQRRRTVDLVGPYNRAFACDYDFWLKAAGFCRFAKSRERLVAYRLHGNSSSTGPGAARGRMEGAWTRAQNRSDVTIADLYPELTQLGPEPPTVSKAFTHLALSLLEFDPRGAADAILAESDRAEQHLPSVLGRYSRAIALAAKGDLDQANATLAQLASLGFEPARLAQNAIAELRAGRGGSIPSVRPELACPELADVRPATSDRVWRLDGSLRAAHVVQCGLDWSRPEVAVPLVEQFCRRFRRDQDIQLCFVGERHEHEAAGQIIAALTTHLGATMDQAADLILLAPDELPADRTILPASTPLEVRASCTRLDALHRRWLFEPSLRLS